MVLEISFLLNIHICSLHSIITLNILKPMNHLITRRNIQKKNGLLLPLMSITPEA